MAPDVDANQRADITTVIHCYSYTKKTATLILLLLYRRKEVGALPHPRPPLVLKMAPDVDTQQRSDIATVIHRYSYT